MRKLAYFAGGLAIGCGLSVYLGQPLVLLLVGLGLTVLALAAVIFGLPQYKRTALIALGLTAGICLARGYYELFLRPVWELEGQTISTEAEITDSSIQSYGTRAEARVTLGNRSFKGCIYFYNREIELEPGDVISLRGKISPATDSESRRTYGSMGLSMRIAAEGKTEIISHGDGTFKYLPAKMARKLSAGLDEVFPENVSALLHGLLLGDKTGLDSVYISQVRQTGMSHVLVVSGLHVGFLLAFFNLIIRKKRLAALIGIPAVAVFVAMVGFTPSAVRAGIMYAAAMTAPVFKRENDGITSLLAALGIILLFNPYAIAAISLQLSFAATAGMTVFAPSVYSWVEKHWPKTVKTVPGRAILSTVAASLGVMVLSVPLAALYFGTFTLISPISNLLTLWAFELAFLLALVTLTVHAVFAPLAIAPAFLTGIIVKYIDFMMETLSKFQLATMSTDEPLVLGWLMFVYLLLILSVVFKARRPWVQLGAAAFMLLVVLGAGYFSDASAEMVFTAFNVGQGQSLMVSSRGCTAVIDCGGDDQPAQTLITGLGEHSVTSVDCLILTHYHEDHAGGVTELLERFPIERIVMPDIADTTGNREEITQTAQKLGIEITVLNTDAVLTLGDSSIRIFAHNEQGEQNEACLSMVITHDDYDIVITGDMSATQEAMLVENRELPDAELLIAGHHGSKNATGEALLDAITPEVVFVSVGENNNYGHPHEDFLKRLEDRDIVIHRTDLEGDLSQVIR